MNTSDPLVSVTKLAFEKAAPRTRAGAEGAALATSDACGGERERRGAGSRCAGGASGGRGRVGAAARECSTEGSGSATASRIAKSALRGRASCADWGRAGGLLASQLGSWPPVSPWEALESGRLALERTAAVAAVACISARCRTAVRADFGVGRGRGWGCAASALEVQPRSASDAPCDSPGARCGACTCDASPASCVPWAIRSSCASAGWGRGTVATKARWGSGGIRRFNGRLGLGTKCGSCSNPYPNGSTSSRGLRAAMEGRGGVASRSTVRVSGWRGGCGAMPAVACRRGGCDGCLTVCRSGSLGGRSARSGPGCWVSHRAGSRANGGTGCRVDSRADACEGSGAGCRAGWGPGGGGEFSTEGTGSGAGRRTGTDAGGCAGCRPRRRVGASSGSGAKFRACCSAGRRSGCSGRCLDWRARCLLLWFRRCRAGRRVGLRAGPREEAVGD